MRRRIAPRRSSVIFCLILAHSAVAKAEPIEVVTTLPAYAAIAEALGGNLVHAQSISRGDEDAHFVKPKPSFALMLRNADLFVTTGLDLELWTPVLLDKSGNRAIREGQPGYVNASQGVPLLDAPASADRSGGDVHAYGNPHIFTSPLNAKIIAGNISAGLARVDADHADSYRQRLAEFRDEIDRALYGDELLEILGSDILDPLARKGELIPFLRGRELAGRPLLDRLGGWLGRARPIHGQKIVTYHKNWICLTRLLGLEVVDYVEPKPGIPPSARHVHQLVELIKKDRVRVLLAAHYFKASQVEAIAERTGSIAVRVPMGPLEDGPRSVIEVFDLWIQELVHAFEETEGS